MTVPLKFNKEFNIGTVATILAVIATGVTTYTAIRTDITRAEEKINAVTERVARVETRSDPSSVLADHEARIRGFEVTGDRQRVERLQFQQEVLQVLSKIREDVSALKARENERRLP